MSLLFFILGPSLCIGLFFGAIWLAFRLLGAVFQSFRGDLIAENERLRAELLRERNRRLI